MGRQASELVRGLKPGEVRNICAVLLLSRRRAEEALGSVKCSLSAKLVDDVVKAVKEVSAESALVFVRWAGQQRGVVASLDSYSRLVSSLARASRFPAVWEVMEEMDRHAYMIPPASFATLIQSYGKAKMVDEALSAFDRMPQFMCKPNQKTYVALITVLVESGQCVKALSVYRQMLEKGLFPSPALCTTVLHGLGVSGDADAAAGFIRHLLETGWTVGAPMYNALLQGYVKSGKFEAAYQTFLGMRGSGDVLSYNLMLAECCKAGQLLGGGLKIYLEMVSKGYSANPDTIRDLVSGLSATGRLEEALKVVLASKDRVTATSYNIVINAFCKRGECERGLELVAAMRSFRVAPTVVTYNTLVDGLCKAGKVEAAMELFREIQTLGCEPNACTYNALIDGLCAAERLEEAFTLLRGMTCKATVVNKNTLVNGICKRIIAERERREFGKHGQKVFQEEVTRSCAVEEARLALLYACLEYMFGSDGGHRPTRFTYSIVIHFLCKASKVVEAAKVWSAMKRRMDNNVDAVAYNSFLYGLVQLGDVDEVRRLFDQIEDPTMISHSLLLDAYLKSGDFSMGFQVYEEMVRRGLTVDEVVYNIILNGLSKAKLNTQMGEVCADMLNNGVPPSQNSYNILINALCSDGRLEAATEVLGTMKERGCMPDVVTYNTVLHHLCKNGHVDEAVKLFREMKHNCGYDPATWNSILHGILQQLRDVAAAEPIFSELIKDGFFPEHITPEMFIDRVRQVRRPPPQQQQQAEPEVQPEQTESTDSERESTGDPSSEEESVPTPSIVDHPIDLPHEDEEEDETTRQQRSLLAFGYSRIVGFFVD